MERREALLDCTVLYRTVLYCTDFTSLNEVTDFVCRHLRITHDMHDAQGEHIVSFQAGIPRQTTRST